jgi:ComF family protein
MEPPAFDVARAALRFDHKSRELIHAYKYHDRHHLVPLFTHWLLTAGDALLENAELVVPVPLSRRRLFTRSYNQAALLARRVAKAKAIAYAPLLLERTRHTRPQAGLGRKARERNIAGAFRVAEKERLLGKRIVLIDDVMTTGMTADACARVLKNAGAAHVAVLTIARVMGEDA